MWEYPIARYAAQNLCGKQRQWGDLREECQVAELFLSFQGVCGFPCSAHLRRHQRDHEGAHRSQHRQPEVRNLDVFMVVEHRGKCGGFCTNVC